VCIGNALLHPKDILSTAGTVSSTPAIVAGVEVLIQQRCHHPQVRQRHVLSFRCILLTRLHRLRGAILLLRVAAAAGGRTRRSGCYDTPQQVDNDLQGIGSVWVQHAVFVWRGLAQIGVEQRMNCAATLTPGQQRSPRLGSGQRRVLAQHLAPCGLRKQMPTSAQMLVLFTTRLFFRSGGWHMHGDEELHRTGRQLGAQREAH
jgi:hypothetical protein